MPTSIVPLSKAQFGIEGTKGTAVAATRLLDANCEAAEEQDFYRSDYPRGVRAMTGDVGVIVRKGMTFNFDSDLSAEQVLLPLLTGIASVTPTAGTTPDTSQKWVFAPSLSSGDPSLKTATLEYVQGDGTTNHYFGKSAYAFTQSFKVDYAFNQVGKLSWVMAGRARQTGAPTASLTTYTGLEGLASNLTAVYLDSAWEDLGTTQLECVVRSASLEVTTGLEPDYTMNGRADLDYCAPKLSQFQTKLSLVMEMDASGAARIADYRANNALFIRLSSTGSTITGGSEVKTVQFDGAYRFTGEPKRSADGAQVIVTCDLEGYYDMTAGKTFEATVINALSSAA